MADATTTYAIDNAGPNADGSYNVAAQTYCKRIVVQENYNSVTAPSADLLQKMPSTAANFVNITKGTPAIFTAVGLGNGFAPGQVVGSIKTVSGSITVQQIESQEV